jgi:hypothetical protein
MHFPRPYGQYMRRSVNAFSFYHFSIFINKFIILTDIDVLGESKLSATRSTATSSTKSASTSAG